MNDVIATIIISTAAPVIIIIESLLLKFFPPKINSWYGFRTTISMSNDDIWHYSNKCLSDSWLRIGIILLIASISAMLIFIFIGYIKFLDNLGVILVVIQSIGIVVSLVKIEKKVRLYYKNSIGK